MTKSHWYPICLTYSVEILLHDMFIKELQTTKMRYIQNMADQEISQQALNVNITCKNINWV